MSKPPHQKLTPLRPKKGERHASKSACTSVISASHAAPSAGS